MNTQHFRQKNKQPDLNQFNLAEQEEGEDQQPMHQRKQDAKYELAAKKLREESKIKEKNKKYNYLKEGQQQKLSQTNEFIQIPNITKDRNSLQNESQNQNLLDLIPLKLKKQSQSQDYQQKKQIESQHQDKQSDLKLQLQKHKEQQQKGNQEKQKYQQTNLKIKKLNRGNNHQTDLIQTVSQAFEEQIKKKDYRRCKNQSTFNNLNKVDSFREDNSFKNFKFLSKSFDKQSFQNDFQNNKEEVKKQLESINQQLLINNKDHKHEQMNEKQNYSTNQNGFLPEK